MIIKDKDGWVSEVSQRCSCCTETQELTEVKSQKELAEHWDHCFLTPDMMKRALKPNVIYTFKGQPKFLLLRDCIGKKVYDKSLDALRELPFKKAKASDRDAIRQAYGGEQLIGFFAKYAPNDKLTAPSRDHWSTYVRLWDLFKEMSDLLEFHMSEYFLFHHKMAMSLARPGTPGDEDSVDNGLTNGDLKYPRKANPDIPGTLSWEPNYNIWCSDFSTVQVNKTIVFTAHQDGNNVADTLGCITTFGDFAGGPLVFPRFGVGASVGVRDMLICDSNSEYHGNLGPIVGTRISVVAFLHNTLQSKEARQKAKQAKKKAPLPEYVSS